MEPSKWGNHTGLSVNLDSKLNLFSGFAFLKGMVKLPFSLILSYLVVMFRDFKTVVETVVVNI